MEKPTDSRARLAPWGRVFRRMALLVLLAFALLAATLAIGVWGYMHFEGWEAWKAFHQAALLLAGMGPIDTGITRPASRAFESLYAIFCGVALLGATGVILAPLMHRLLHHFHLEDAGDGD
jgi:predicted ferric reductase